MKRFEHKVVVVTGASRGIGRAIGVAFAQTGATVVGVARGDLAETGAAVAASMRRTENPPAAASTALEPSSLMTWRRVGQHAGLEH